MTATITELETPRLRLRQWLAKDYAAYAAMCADEDVMRYFPRPLTRSESNSKIQKMQKLIKENGWGFWAVELKESGELIGLTGLNKPRDLPFLKGIEVGWQYKVSAWGQGYATEAAKYALEFGFDSLALKNIIAFTAEINQPSRAVMQRLGMQKTAKDFAHPGVPDGNPLKQHVLYTISNEDWLQQKN